MYIYKHRQRHHFKGPIYQELPSRDESHQLNKSTRLSKGYLHTGHLSPPYSPRLFIRSVGPKATFQNVGYFLLVNPSLA